MPDKPQIDLIPDPPATGRSSASGNALVPTRQTVASNTLARHPVRPKASRWRRRSLAIGLAFVSGIGGWILYAQPWHAVTPLVMVEIVAPGPVTRVLAVNGRIAALRSVSVKSTVAGTLVAPLADEGDTVQEGSVIARLDDTSQQAAVRQAMAALDQQLLVKSQALAALKRAETLGGTVSTVTLEDARASVEQADQEVGRLQALVDQAQFQLTKFDIVAPITGTVLKRGVDPGQVVDLTTTLFTLADVGELVVETDVDESYAAQIRAGMPAVLQLTGDDRKLDGTVSFVAPVVDADTGGLAVKIAFAEPQAAPVGLTVTANIIVDRRDMAISAPRTALVAEGREQSVFVLKGQKAKRVPVAVIDWPAERLIVTTGLKPGDRLITDAGNLADGQTVKLAGQ